MENVAFNRDRLFSKEYQDQVTDRLKNSPLKLTPRFDTSKRAKDYAPGNFSTPKANAPKTTGPKADGGNSKPTIDSSGPERKQTGNGRPEAA